MFDDFEVACWAKFLDRFDLVQRHHTLDEQEAQQRLDSALWTSFYVAYATKLILNNDINLKNRILAHVSQ